MFQKINIAQLNLMMIKKIKISLNTQMYNHNTHIKIYTQRYMYKEMQCKTNYKLAIISI